MQINKSDYLHSPTKTEMRQVKTEPKTTGSGKPFDWYVEEQIRAGKWHPEWVRPDVLGLKRPIEILRAPSPGKLISPWNRSDSEDVYCPAYWADLKIGRGACGLRCRSCFLMGTHRIWCDPSRPVIYDGETEYEAAVKNWLKAPDRENLGLGIDCCDSLLYEGVTGHARRLIPLFGSARSNPHGCKLILLTKSTNVHYLKELPTENVLLTFSLNPQPIADMWEGKFDDGVRVTPSVEQRLRASLFGQGLGFEVRWRIDPIFPVKGWPNIYRKFFQEAAREGNRPTRITLGTYREMQPSLLTFARRWGLPPLEADRPDMQKDGDHYHLGRSRRIEIYRSLASAVIDEWVEFNHLPDVALCKEPKSVRREAGLDNKYCNCG